jgi:four helix bundle protein
MQTDYKKNMELSVWLEVRKLVNIIYSATKQFPKEEQFGLTNQMRRCVISIPSNIAESCGRNHKKYSLQFFLSQEGLYMSSKHNYI